MSKPTRAARGGRHRGPMRAIASLLGAALIFASIVPPFALAEAESEGEGGAPPGGIPGLEITIGGEGKGGETALEEVPVGPGEEVEEEVPPVSEGGAPEAPPPAPVAAPEEEAPAPTSGEVAGSPQTEAPPAAPAATPPPSYTPEGTSPSYETALEPVGEAVRNEAIVAPTTSAPEQHPAKHASSGSVAAAPESKAPAPEPAPVAPEPQPAPTAAAPAASPPVERGGLAGRKSHTVAAGECLWTIAEGYLPSGASNAEIAAEVHRLWVLNAGRIGTGDPDVLPVGTVLRLR
ncbi:MAG: LysM peptidoglycan-binding domain-containing protein [Actinobacteria bacterium]|nr:LysM peptidoglycan-binding domain-containing protein [Actinomycetota bacterium]